MKAMKFIRAEKFEWDRNAPIRLKKFKWIMKYDDVCNKVVDLEEEKPMKTQRFRSVC